jgi:ribosomal-protein-alanine N-acetyltransferase
MLEMTADEGVKRFTRVPLGADAAFVTSWIDRYERGWEDGSCAGFTVREAESDAYLGFAGVVSLDLDGLEGEIGYMTLPAARGRGVASRSVDLLTAWAFSDLGLERLELRIDVANAASEAIARRNGYTLEGIRRSAYVKDGQRADTGVWSRLPGD